MSALPLAQRYRCHTGGWPPCCSQQEKASHQIEREAEPTTGARAGTAARLCSFASLWGVAPTVKGLRGPSVSPGRHFRGQSPLRPALQPVLPRLRPPPSSSPHLCTTEPVSFSAGARNFPAQPPGTRALAEGRALFRRDTRPHARGGTRIRTSRPHPHPTNGSLLSAISPASAIGPFSSTPTP